MESKNVTAVLEGKRLTVQVDYPEETSAVLLKFDSARNRPVSRFSDRSPRDGGTAGEGNTPGRPGAMCISRWWIWR